MVGSLVPRLADRCPGRPFDMIVGYARMSPRVTFLKEEVVGDVEIMLWILLGTVGLTGTFSRLCQCGEPVPRACGRTPAGSGGPHGVGRRTRTDGPPFLDREHDAGHSSVELSGWPLPSPASRPSSGSGPKVYRGYTSLRSACRCWHSLSDFPSLRESVSG